MAAEKERTASAASIKVREASHVSSDTNNIHAIELLGSTLVSAHSEVPQGAAIETEDEVLSLRVKATGDLENPRLKATTAIDDIDAKDLVPVEAFEPQLTSGKSTPSTEAPVTNRSPTRTAGDNDDEATCPVSDVKWFRHDHFDDVQRHSPHGMSPLQSNWRNDRTTWWWQMRHWYGYVLSSSKQEEEQGHGVLNWIKTLTFSTVKATSESMAADMLLLAAECVYQSLVFVAVQELTVWVLMVTAVGLVAFVFKTVTNLLPDIAVDWWESVTQWRHARAHAPQDVTGRRENQAPTHPLPPNAPTSSRSGAVAGAAAGAAARSAASSRTAHTRRKTRRAHIFVSQPPIVLSPPPPRPSPGNRTGPRSVSPTCPLGHREMLASSTVHTRTAEKISRVSDTSTLSITEFLARSARQRQQWKKRDMLARGCDNVLPSNIHRVKRGKRLLRRHPSKSRGLTLVCMRILWFIVVWLFVGGQICLQGTVTWSGVRHLFAYAVTPIEFHRKPQHHFKI